MPARIPTIWVWQIKNSLPLGALGAPLTSATTPAFSKGCPPPTRKWNGIAHAPSTGKRYAAPANADAVLVIDPMTNTTDVTTLAGLKQMPSIGRDTPNATSATAIRLMVTMVTVLRNP